MNALLTTEIKNIDKENMFDTIANLYKQIEASIEMSEKTNITFKSSNINNIVFSGMGGSAVGGVLLKDYLYNEIKVPFTIIRNYDIPKFVGEDTLIFVSSYSGDTKETLSIYEKAKQKGAKIVSITSGGKLKEISEKDNTSTITVPSGMSSPRCALGYSFTIPLITLMKLGIIDEKSQEIEETINILRAKSKEFSEIENPEKNPALILANKLFNKLPIIYSPEPILASVGYRWKCQFCENSKVMAYNNYFTELNHNEIMGWEWKKFRDLNPIVIILNDREIGERIQKTIEITYSLLNEENVPIEQFWSKGKSLLSRIFSLLYLGDFTSFYLAMLYNTDPTPIKKIETLRRRLNKNIKY